MKIHTPQNFSESEDGKNHPGIILVVGFMILGALAVMAWVLFKERLFHYDPAFQSFMVLQEQAPFIVHNRFGMLLGQLIPLALIPQIEDLETILRITSVSYIITHIFFLLIIGLVFKSKNGVIAFCIALTLTFRETFYFSTVELSQSFGFVVLLWVMFHATLKKRGWKRNAGLILCSLIVVIISYFHPITLFLVTFVLLVEYIRRKKWTDPYAILVILWALLWYFIRIKVIAQSAYEEKRMLSFEALLENLPNIHHLFSTNYFLTYFKENYLAPFIICALALIYLFYRRKWITGLFIVLYTIAFWVIIMVGMREERSPIMLQNYYIIFGLFGGVLMALSLESLSKKTSAFILTGICVFSIFSIYQARYYHDLRTRFIESIAVYGQAFEQRKFIIDKNHIPWSYSWMDWALAHGTLMFSEIKPGLEPVTFYATAEPDTLTDRDIKEPNSFLGPPFAPHWHNIQALNSTYFHLSQGSYRILNTDQNLETLTDSILVASELSINANEEIINRRSGHHAIEINLTNNTNTLIGSRPLDLSGVYLYRKLLNTQGEVLEVENKLLLLDIYPGKSYLDLIPYDHPSGKNYMMEIGFFRDKPAVFFPKDTVALNIE